MVGATRLIDGGGRELFLFLAAARSAIVTGEFDLAKRIYESLDGENLAIQVRRPFDVLAEGSSVLLSRADRI